MALCKRGLAAVFYTFFLSFFALSALTSAANAQADIALSTLHDSMDPIVGGLEYSYTMRLHNHGDQPAEKARVTLPIPKTIKFISVSPAEQCSHNGKLGRVECDFGTLQADAGSAVNIDIVVQGKDKGPKTVTLSASTTTSSDELITNNNQQSETTSFADGSLAGLDIGVTRLVEVVGAIGKNVRSYDVIVKNIGSEDAKDAKLIVMMPSLLKFHSASPEDSCKFDKESGQLSCALAMLEPLEKGGEEIAVRINLSDDSKTNGAVKIKAVVLASGEDVIVANDMQELVVTLGTGGPKPLMLAENDQADKAPENTAAIDGSSSGPATTGGSVAKSPSSGGSSSSSSGSNGSGLFSGGLATKTSGPSGGDVDFQIQNFETDPDEVPAGAQFTLNTSLINNGPDAANNAQLDITVPEGVEFVSGPGVCVHDGNPPTGASQVLCSFGDLANGATVSVPVIFRAVIPGRVVRSFSAVIDSASNETNVPNNSQSVNFTIANGDDLLLAIDAVPNPAVAGGNVTYGLTVTNQGLNIAEGASVIFNLPPGITYVNAGSGGNGWSCSAAGQVVTCSSGANIAATNGTVSFSIVGNIGVGSGTYTASATVFSTITPDVDGVNDTATYDLIVQPGTDLSVAKSVSQNPMYGGSTPTFTITVTNNGPITAQNLVLTDNLPAGFTFVSAVGAGWTCGNAGQLVTCTRPNLAVGFSDVVITVNAPVNAAIPEAGTNIINSASISSDTNDAVAGNDTGSVNFDLQRDGADLQISFSRTPKPVAQNSNITNSVRVQNRGPRVATGNIRVTYLLAAGETYASVSGAGWSLTGQVGSLVTFEHAGPLAVNAYTPYMDVITTAVGAGTLTSRVCTSNGLDAGTDTGLEPNEGDPVRSNNCASDGVNSTVAIADLVVGKSAALDPLTTGDATQTYTLTVRNDGPDTAVDVHLTDTISNWVAAYDDRPATTVTASSPAGTCTVNNAAVACDLNDILNGATATVTVTVTRPVSNGAAIVNTASAYSYATGDNNRSNNIATITTQVDAVTDLKLRSAIWSPNPVKAGVEATYVITFRNNGPSTANAVTLQSQFGGDFTFISATPSTGSCAAFGSGAANRLDCTIGNMGNRNQQTVTVVVRPNHPAGADITNTSTVSTTTHETNLGNNDGGTDLSVVDAEIDLDVAQTDVVDPVGYTPGVPLANRIIYRVEVNNFGPSFATGVNFVDSFTPPAGAHRLQFVCDKAGAGDACPALGAQICNNQGTIALGGATESTSCAIGDMAAGSNYVRYLEYEVLDIPIAGGETHQKSIVVSANENDIIPANDTAIAQTTVRIRTDVAAVCAAPPGSDSIREPFNLQVTVSNGGPGDSQETTFTQSLPTGMVLTAQPSPDNGSSCSGSAGSTSYTCDLGVVGVGGGNNVIVTIPVRFTTLPAGGTYTYSASVATNEIDTNSSNNSCTSAQGAVTTSTLAGFVYEDHNDDGDMDGGETPISGVTIRLTGTDAYGNNVNLSRNTDGSGFYRFSDLSPANGAGYTVTETRPANYSDGLENAGGSTVVGDHSDNLTSAIANITLGINQNFTHYDFGELAADLEVVSKVPSLPTVSIRQPFNYTIIVRNNGPATATSSALADNLPAGIELTATPTTVPVHACTGNAGDGSFTCDFGTMNNGDSITVTVPVILASIPGAVASMTNTATASTSRNEVTLANNSKSGTVNTISSSIACVVYQDLNDDGTKIPAEPGIGGVTMTLTGTDDFGNSLGAGLTTVTAGDGTCSFQNLSPSTAGVGGGYTLTESQPGAFGDGQDNNGGNASTPANDNFSAIIVAPGVDLVNFQFGELPPTGISGTVWCDDNNNGVIDGPETTRIAGVTMTLTGQDAIGFLGPVNTVTDANGYYHFDIARPSVGAGYTVTQTQNTAHACNVPGLASSGTVGGVAQGTPDNNNASATYGNVISNIVIADASRSGVSYNFGEMRPASLAGAVFNDNDRDDVKDPGEPGIVGVSIALSCTDYRGNNYTASTTTLPNGTYSFTDLLPTSGAGCSITETQPANHDDGGEILGNLGGTVGADVFTGVVLRSGDAGTDYDFAERSAGLSGYVYVDGDNDGIFDGGEPPIPGVVVTLTGIDANGAVTKTATTDANGYYLFTGLLPSTGNGYKVSETQPIAWADGKDTAGSLGGTVVNDEISAIVLGANDFATNYNFGERGGSLSGFVFTDLNNDGVHDATESGIPGVQITLQCTDINGQVLAPRTTLTAGNGSYSFINIPATSGVGCRITEATPPNTTDGKDHVGTLGGTLGNDDLSAIPLAPGEHGTEYDFGEILVDPARISGHVWHDSNHDRTNNDGNPESGWTVELINRATPSDCQSAFGVVATQVTNAAGEYAFEGVSPGTYDIRFRSPTGGYIYAGAQSGGSTGAITPCGIGSILVVSGDNIIDQDLPLDPSGVVYDSLTRIPVPGATVSIHGPAGFDPALHLVGGTPNVSQTTGDDGYYQFLLFVGAPVGEYSLSVDQRPDGYVPIDSAIIPACTNTLTVGQFPTPALVHSGDTAPVLAAASHTPANCPANSAGLAASAGSTQYYFTFNLDPALPSGNVVNNHIPLDPVTEGAFTVAKSTPKINVSIGELVPYTITASNNLNATLPNIELEDQLPPGFKYKPGSASLDGVRSEPVISGRQLTWPNLTFTANQKRTIKLLMIVGSGVSEGDYINKAWAENGFIQALASNIATAKVRVIPDPTFDCAGVIGKVFDDKNRNGYQDKGEMGLANVRLATVRGLLVTTDKFGRYHVACADVPNPDRGSTFIMKLDHRTLPSGFRLTTENPRAIRLTRGKIGKLNFGVAIHRVVRLDITRDAFTGRGDDLKRAWQSGISRLVGVLDRGPSILRIAYARENGESPRAVRKRINILKRQITELWRRKRRRVLVIETESYLSAKGSFK